MKRLACIAAVIAIGCAGFAGCNKDENKSGSDNASPGQKAGDAVRKGVDSTTQGVKSAADSVTAGVAPSGTSSMDGTRSTLEGVVENALKRNNYNDMADHFTKADADRVKNGKPDTTDLDDLADKVTSAWNSQYNDKFSVMSADKVFAADFLTLATDASGTKDNPRATGTIPASHGLPELTMTFVGEGGKWRLDIPDTVDAQKLHDNLKSALTALQDTSHWPADKNDAYRAVSHHIIAAVMDKLPAGTASAQ
jgi:hypothetical protein